MDIPRASTSEQVLSRRFAHSMKRKGIDASTHVVIIRGSAMSVNTDSGFDAKRECEFFAIFPS